MKKFLLLALAIILVFSLGACKGNNGDDSTDSSSGTNVQNQESTETGKPAEIDEERVKLLLSDFDSEITGLQENVNDYYFKLTKATFNGEAAVRAEAFSFGNNESQGVFFIVGEDCYRYDSAENKYNILTAEQTLEIEDQVQIKETEKEGTTEEPGTTQKTVDDINDDNNSVMHKRFAKYDLSELEIPKPISEYEFQMTGNAVTTTDGTTAYVVYLMEDGRYTAFTFAFSPDKDYYYDPAADEYKPIPLK